MGALTTFVANADLAELKASWLSDLALRTRIRQADGAAHDAWGSYRGPGGVHRLAVLVNVVKPGAGWEVVCVDSEIDWRDRLMLVYACDSSLLISQASVWPGNQDHNLQHLDRDLHYTGSGIAEAQGVSGRHLRIGSNNLLLFARDTDGTLFLQRSASDAYGLPRSIILRIFATEKLGERGTPGYTMPAIAAIDGNVIDPHDLNNVQDTGMLAQVRSGPNASIDPSIIGSDERSDAMPLGPFTRGYPRVPEWWAIKDSTGAEREVRQPVAGSLHRFFSITIGDGVTLTLDSSEDWRDRFIWGAGKWSAAEIRPGETGDDTHNAADEWFLPSNYLGPGGDDVTFSTTSYHMILETGEALLIYADEDTGALKIHNNAGATRYVTGMIEGSFQLGPRTPIE